MHLHQYLPASSGQWLRRHDLLNFITALYEGDLHAKRVLSLANATLGVLTSASLAIHAVGRGLAQAMGTLTKHGVKQVDRLLSNRGVDVWTFFAYWTPFIVGARTEVVVALDWTSFAADRQDTIVLAMVTGHGRATPLLWKTVASSTLKGNQRRYEYEVLCRLREVLPAGVKVTVVADRGFADCKLFYALTTELAFEYVIRLRGDIYVTNARGERRAAAAWVGAGGRARRLVGARVTDAYELPVGVVVCVQDPKMDEPWCLVASEATVPTRVLIRYYGKRWGIEAGFRDIKDLRFGMGLSSMHVSRPDRRDRLLLISALAIAMLSLLGAAGERIGYDRWLKANTREAADAFVVSAGADAVPPSPQLAGGSDSSVDGDVRKHAHGTTGVSRGFRRDLMLLQNEGMHEGWNPCSPFAFERRDCRSGRGGRAVRPHSPVTRRPTPPRPKARRPGRAVAGAPFLPACPAAINSPSSPSASIA